MTFCCALWPPTSLNLWESPQEGVHHQLGLLPQIMPVLELAEVSLQVLLRNPNMRPRDSAFHIRPETFDGIGMNVAANPFLFGVID